MYWNQSSVHSSVLRFFFFFYTQTANGFLQHFFVVKPNSSAAQLSKTCSMSCIKYLPCQLCVIFGWEANNFYFFFFYLMSKQTSVATWAFSFSRCLLFKSKKGLITQPPCHLPCSHLSPPRSALPLYLSHPLLWSYKVSEQNFQRGWRILCVCVCVCVCVSVCVL